jgi:hypothetical protein
MRTWYVKVNEKEYLVRACYIYRAVDRGIQEYLSEKGRWNTPYEVKNEKENIIKESLNIRHRRAFDYEKPYVYDIQIRAIKDSDNFKTGRAGYFTKEIVKEAKSD